jgi:hypothetical protein
MFALSASNTEQPHALGSARQSALRYGKIKHDGREPDAALPVVPVDRIASVGSPSTKPPAERSQEDRAAHIEIIQIE